MCVRFVSDVQNLCPESGSPRDIGADAGPCSCRLKLVHETHIRRAPMERHFHDAAASNMNELVVCEPRPSLRHHIVPVRNVAPVYDP